MPILSARNTRQPSAAFAKNASHYEHTYYRSCFRMCGLPRRLMPARTKIATRNDLCPLAARKTRGNTPRDSFMSNNDHFSAVIRHADILVVALTTGNANRGMGIGQIRSHFGCFRETIRSCRTNYNIYFDLLQPYTILQMGMYF